MNRTRLTCVTVAAALAASSLVTARQAAAPQTPPPTAAAAGPAPQGGRGGGPVKSPEVGADGRVTFRLRAPNANEVAVSVGGKRLPMQKDEQGVWSVDERSARAGRLHVLARSSTATTINDPSNRQVQTSFGSFQSMFVVPGPKPWLPAPGCAARRDRPSRVSLGRRQRRPRLLRLHAARLRRAAARSRTRCCTCCTVSATMPSAG